MSKLFGLFCLLMCAMPAAVAEFVSDQDMKAALVYNFAVFTTWPENKLDDFTICTYYEDQESLNREMLESKTINGRPIHFQVLHYRSSLSQCNVLYVEESRNIDDQRTLERVTAASVLLIVDSTNKSTNLGIVNLQLSDKKYLFSVNNEAAKKSNLLLSSKLLRLATKVY